MSYLAHLRDFITNKLEDNKLSRKDIAEAAGISQGALSLILNDYPLSLQSVLGLANAFSTGIDEILGRDNPLPPVIPPAPVSASAMNSALNAFIKTKLDETHLSIYELSERCGCSRTTFDKFLKKGKNPEASLSLKAAISLADYFNVSLDEITGRSASTTKQQHTEDKVNVKPFKVSTKAPHALKGMSKMDQEIINQIREDIQVISDAPAQKPPLPPKPIGNNRYR